MQLVIVQIVAAWKVAEIPSRYLNALRQQRS
jgi:hypothetical protein